MQSFRQIGSKLWKIGAIQNRYPNVVYGVMSDSGIKNPRPMYIITFEILSYFFSFRNTNVNEDQFFL